jgi:hypothetical protein
LKDRSLALGGLVRLQQRKLTLSYTCRTLRMRAARPANIGLHTKRSHINCVMSEVFGINQAYVRQKGSAW